MDISGISSLPLFVALLMVVAFLYGSVGHGGASGYLALMAVWAVPISVMKPTALVLNCFVASIAFEMFLRMGHFRWSLFWPFVLASVPMAFLGGWIDPGAELYRKILGVVLLIAILRMFGVLGKPKTDEIRATAGWQMLTAGAGIGFLSGLIGIGGGILLSPLIMLMRWGSPKEAAAVSSGFIVINSVAGLVGFTSSGGEVDGGFLVLLIPAAIGASAGAWLGSTGFSNLALTRTLAVVMSIAAFKLILT
jgi:uncharacterized protein